MAWHWMDYVIVGIIAISVLTGLIRGFVKEIIALSVWIVAVWLSFVYAKPLAHWLNTYIQDKSAQVVLAYVLIIVGTLIVGGILNTIISFMMHRSGLSGTDRLLGLGFGFLRGIFVVGLIMIVIKISAMPEEDYQKKSLLYAHFNPLVNWLYQYTPDVIKRVETIEHHAMPTSHDHADIEVKDLQSL
ncbi:MAG TPA: CvpA family protein [Legionellaceae bacterium]|nr:CvpA family protein [Legionellaceae bacterium]